MDESEPTSEELTESIKILTAYRDRLHKEVTNVAHKLRISDKKVKDGKIRFIIPTTIGNVKISLGALRNRF